MELIHGDGIADGWMAPVGDGCNVQYRCRQVMSSLAIL